MSVDPALLDANVLVYAIVLGSPHHEPPRRISDGALAGDISACVTAQVLLDVFSIAANPKRVTPHQSAAAVWNAVAVYQNTLRVLPAPDDLLERMQALAEPLGITGARIFDVQHAATMLANGVSRVYTFDADVFGRVPGITTVRSSWSAERFAGQSRAKRSESQASSPSRRVSRTMAVAYRGARVGRTARSPSAPRSTSSTSRERRPRWPFRDVRLASKDDRARGAAVPMLRSRGPPLRFSTRRCTRTSPCRSHSRRSRRSRGPRSSRRPGRPCRCSRRP